MNVPPRTGDLASDTRREPVTPAPGDPLSCKCVGRTITTPPPVVPGPGEYGPSPTLPAVPQAARCGNLPLQTITPRSPVSTQLRSSAANYAVNGSEFWSTVWYFKLRPI